MGKPKRIGVEVDRDLWEEFRQDVKERKGRVSGVLGAELENAIRQYIYDGGNASTEERLTRIENKLNAAIPGDSDGGTTPETAHTHARAADTPTPEEKPAANQPRAEKAAWIVADMDLGDNAKVPRAAIETKVQKEYNLGERSLEPMVDAVAERIQDTE